MSHDDFNFEPIRGLPEALPADEYILWQGRPNSLRLAKDAWSLNWVIGYFVALAVIRVITVSDMMSLKSFREDLYHRLNVIHIDMPPLRERLEDVPLLASHFINRYYKTFARGKVYLSPDVARILSGYHWSGNIRELENVIKRALMLAMSGPILTEHLPPHLQEDVSTNDVHQWDDRLNQLLKDFLLNKHEDGAVYETLIQKVEKHLFEILLSKYSGKQVATAKVLGINRNTLKRKIDSMKISLKNHKSNNS